MSFKQLLTNKNATVTPKSEFKYSCSLPHPSTFSSEKPKIPNTLQLIFEGSYKPNFSTFPLIGAKFFTYNVPSSAFLKFPSLNEKSGRPLKSVGYVPIEGFSRFFLTWAERSNIKPLFGWVEGSNFEERNKIERVADEFRKKGLVEGCNFSNNCTLHFMHISDFQTEFLEAVGLANVFPDEYLDAGRISLVFVITLKRIQPEFSNCIMPKTVKISKKMQNKAEKENASKVIRPTKDQWGTDCEDEAVRKKVKHEKSYSTPNPRLAINSPYSAKDENMKCDKSLQTIRSMLDMIGSRKDNLIKSMNETFYSMSKKISQKVGVTQFDDEFLLTFKDKSECKQLQKNFNMLSDNFEKFTSMLKDFEQNERNEEGNSFEEQRPSNSTCILPREPLQNKSMNIDHSYSILKRSRDESGFLDEKRSLSEAQTAPQKVIINIRNCDPAELDAEDFWKHDSQVSSLIIQLNREKLDDLKIKNLANKFERLACKLTGVKTISLIVKSCNINENFTDMLAYFFDEVKHKVNNLLIHFAKTNLGSKGLAKLLDVFSKARLTGFTIYLRETLVDDQASHYISDFLLKKPNFVKFALRSLNINILSSKMVYGTHLIQDTLKNLKMSNVNLKFSFNFL